MNWESVDAARLQGTRLGNPGPKKFHWVLGLDRKRRTAGGNKPRLAFTKFLTRDSADPADEDHDVKAR